MDQKIQKAEEQVESLQQQLQNPEIMSDSERLAEIYAQQQEAEEKVEALYQRWEELDALSQE